MIIEFLPSYNLLPSEIIPQQRRSFTPASPFPPVFGFTRRDIYVRDSSGNEHFIRSKITRSRLILNVFKEGKYIPQGGIEFKNMEDADEKVTELVHNGCIYESSN